MAVEPAAKRTTRSSNENVRDGAVWKSFKHIVAGGCAGLAEVTIMHPTDVIKTRFQLQRGPSGLEYSSMSDCVKKMVKSEGLLSLYKGIVPRLVAEIPTRATKFFGFETYHSLLVSMGFTDPQWTVLAGFGGGMTEAIILTPFDRVKVYLQAQRTRVSEQPSALSAVRHIVHTDGYGRNGLNRGLTATIARHGVWTAVYFGTYHNLKAWLFSKKLQSIHQLFLGFFAGSIAAVANNPFDVAKSRIQGPQSHKKSQKHLFRTLITILQEEGPLALCKGLLPRLIRLGPGGAIMMLVYQQAVNFF